MALDFKSQNHSLAQGISLGSIEIAAQNAAVHLPDLNHEKLCPVAAGFARPERMPLFCLACWEQVTFVSKQWLLQTGTRGAGRGGAVEASSSQGGPRGLSLGCVCVCFK